MTYINNIINVIKRYNIATKLYLLNLINNKNSDVIIEDLMDLGNTKYDYEQRYEQGYKQKYDNEQKYDNKQGYNNEQDSVEYPIYNKYDHVILHIKDDIEYVDKSKELKDICTDIVTNLFFTDDLTLFNFLLMVCEKYDIMIKNFTRVYDLAPDDIIFIYKGGNILRIISNEFKDKLPQLAADILKVHYNKYFARSDCDFAIYINPKIKHFESIFRKISIESYCVQIDIRNNILKHKYRKLDIFKYSQEYTSACLLEYLKKFINAECLRDPTNEIYYGKSIIGISFMESQATMSGNTLPVYHGRQDYGVQKTHDQLNLGLFPLSNQCNDIYLSFNDSLEFDGNSENSHARFNLIRAKVGFNIYFSDGSVKNIGGELIDVSINHKDDYKSQLLFRDVDHSLTTYELYHNSDKINRLLTFKSYTLEHLTIDLELILFVEHKPWEDKKYVKRLYRLFYLYFIDIFIKMEDKLSTIDSFISFCSKNLKFRKTIFIAQLSKMKTHGIHLNIYNVYNYLLILAQNLIPEDIPEFQQLITEIHNNLVILRSIIYKIQSFCSKSKKKLITNTDISKHIDFNNLLA
jgi:hypothetical protein